jgi:hypothetical protein
MVVTNLNFEQLNVIETPDPVIAVIRLDDLNYFYTVDRGGYFTKYNNDGVIIYRNQFLLLAQMYDYDYDSSSVYALGFDPFLQTTRVLQIDLNSGIIDDVNQTLYSSYYYGASSLNEARTINVKNKSLYFTDGDKAERFLNTIYFRKVYNDGYGIYSWNIAANATTPEAVSLVLSAYNSLEDYDIDLDGNLWALYDHKSYIRINSNRLVTLSGTLPLSGCISTNIDFGFNLKDNELQQFALISTLAQSDKSVTYKIDGSGNIISVYYAKNTGANNTSITQSSYLRYYYSEIHFLAYYLYQHIYFLLFRKCFCH